MNLRVLRIASIGLFTKHHSDVVSLNLSVCEQRLLRDHVGLFDDD